MSFFRKEWPMIAICLAIIIPFVASALLLDGTRERREAKEKAYADHIRKTCKQLERNRPERGNTYDTFDCNGVVEWVYVGQ